MNTEQYITLIKSINFLGTEELDIPLNPDKRKHLIITGKNGAGKTSLLKKIKEVLESKEQFDVLIEDYHEKMRVHNQYREPGKEATWVSGIDYPTRDFGIIYHCQRTPSYIVYLEDNRHSDRIIHQGSLEKVKTKDLSDHLMQYLINQKFTQLLAVEEEDLETVDVIKKWFSDFEKKLSQILGYKTHLKFNTKDFNFQFVKEDNSIIYPEALPSGYYALVEILSEIMMGTKLNQSAVVLIDEIETHLHVEFQKMVLPWLVDFFPNIQFIITTHSPFVVSSLSNAVICDLEKKIVTEDLSGYGYDTLVESFFGTSLISDELKSKISRYDELDLKKDKTPEEQEELGTITNYLTSLPKYLPNELSLKIKSIELSNRHK